MKGQSEPPDKIDINIRTGLKKGFPIKISGYAVGGENNPVNICDNNQRFRSRRNSESSLERPKRGSTPDPAKSEEISVKQMYSPLLGIRDRDRNGFRRRSGSSRLYTTGLGLRLGCVFPQGDRPKKSTTSTTRPPFMGNA